MFVIFNENTRAFLTDPYEGTVELYDDLTVASHSCEEANEASAGFFADPDGGGLVRVLPWKVFELLWKEDKPA